MLPPCGRSHQPAAVQLSQGAPLDTAPECDDDDPTDLWLQGVRILSLELDRPELVDLRLLDCDVSGLSISNFVARRLEVSRTRLRGVSLGGGQFDDGRIEDCAASELSLRFTSLRRTIFSDCDLRGADFYRANFDHVTIENCNLQGARFDGATVKCLQLTNCELAGVSGTEGLSGAYLDASDLPGLAISLARDAGIKVVDD
jgi:uncharacterized protein YjbI with pentapeptide repeats